MSLTLKKKSKITKVGHVVNNTNCFKYIKLNLENCLTVKNVIRSTAHNRPSHFIPRNFVLCFVALRCVALRCVALRCVCWVGLCTRCVVFWLLYRRILLIISKVSLFFWCQRIKHVILVFLGCDSKVKRSRRKWNPDWRLWPSVSSRSTDLQLRKTSLHYWPRDIKTWPQRWNLLSDL